MDDEQLNQEIDAREATGALGEADDSALTSIAHFVPRTAATACGVKI